MASTLSIGQATYELLAPLSDASGVKRGSGSTTAFDVRSTTGDTIYELDIKAEQGTNLPGNVNIFSNTYELNANLSGGSDNLNLFGNADYAVINTDGVNKSPGNDFLNAQRDLTNSFVFTESGNDTVRVGGKADNSTFDLGDGNDSLSINGASSNVTVELGAGNDVAQFRGQVSDGSLNAGDGNDTVQFFNGFSGFFNPASVNLGGGNDSLLISGGGSNIQVDAGLGNDSVLLQGSFTDTAFNLGEGRNNLSLTSGSFNETTIQSESSTGDTLIFGAGTSIYNSLSSSGISLGNGSDSVIFGGSVTSLVDIGSGLDTVVFGARSFASGTVLNLGNDSVSDKVYFNMSKTDVNTNFISGLKITNATDADKLYIGAGGYATYSYNSASDYWFNGSDTLKFVG